MWGEYREMEELWKLVLHILKNLNWQSSVLHSQPKSIVGTPAYIAPEVLLKQEYDGKVEYFLGS